MPVRRLVDVVFWLGLMLWCAALVSAAVAAMNVFPAMDDMPLALDRYAAYPVAEHPRLAAGRIMDGVFFTVDLLQFVAAPLTLAALAGQLVLAGRAWRRFGNLARTALIVAAAVLLAIHVTALAPRMNRALRAYWAAAEAGDVATAHAERSAFNALHPTAERILSINLLLLVVAAATSAALRPEPGPPAPLSSMIP